MLLVKGLPAWAALCVNSSPNGFLYRDFPQISSPHRKEVSGKIWDQPDQPYHQAEFLVYYWNNIILDNSRLFLAPCLDNEKIFKSMESLNFQPIALDHCSRYPGLQVEDLYKLVHQAALGSEHAV